MERNMMLTPDEYLALRRIISSERESEGASISQANSSSSSRPRSRKKNPKLSRALKAANSRAKLKSGKFRKGWNQKRLMKYAHKLKKAYK